MYLIGTTLCLVLAVTGILSAADIRECCSQ